jgi:hypothetical protein
VLPKSSTPLAVGRVSPSAPSAVAQTRTFSRVSAPRGALGETRPTSGPLGQHALKGPPNRTHRAARKPWCFPGSPLLPGSPPVPTSLSRERPSRVSRHAHQMHTRCTPEVHRMSSCASGVHLVCIRCTQPWSRSGRAARPGQRLWGPPLAGPVTKSAAYLAATDMDCGGKQES